MCIRVSPLTMDHTVHTILRMIKVLCGLFYSTSTSFELKIVVVLSATLAMIKLSEIVLPSLVLVIVSANFSVIECVFEVLALHKSDDDYSTRCCETKSCFNYELNIYITLIMLH